MLSRRHNTSGLLGIAIGVVLHVGHMRLVLVGLLVGDEQLAIISVAPRFMFCHAHDINVALDAVYLVEYAAKRKLS